MAGKHVAPGKTTQGGNCYLFEGSGESEFFRPRRIYSRCPALNAYAEMKVHSFNLSEPTEQLGRQEKSSWQAGTVELSRLKER